MSFFARMRSGLARRFSPNARLARALSPYLPDCICVDVGASYYPHIRWRLFLDSPNTRWVAVEPNAANLGYLRSWRWPSCVEAFETGLSRDGGEQTLYVTNVDSGSSLFEPEIPAGMASRVRNLDYFFPVRPVRIQTMTLAQVVERQPGPLPTFVKLDTQGSELSILEGAQQLIDAHRIVGIESEFTMLAQPLMKGSGKFWQACQALEDAGFELKDLKPIYGPSRHGQARVNGLTHLNECDAVFALRPDVAATLPVEYRVALMAFNLSYGFYEEAVSMLEEDRELCTYLGGRGCSIEALQTAVGRLRWPR